MMFVARQATSAECREFGVDVCDVNWGVWLNGKLVALFQAENDGEGWLVVHANVKPRALHPGVTQIYAAKFAKDLLDYGAAGLKAEIPVTNRAAIRLAKAAGFNEIHRNDEWVSLVRYGKEETATATDAVQSDEHLYRVETV